MKGIINESVEMVDINAVSPWPRNPRNGDLGAIAESIRQNGFYGTLTVQKSTGHILAGNHRWMAALEVGLKEVPVAWVDVDDKMAARINLVDNRSANLGWDDDALIAEILNELPSLEGTGYDDEALAEIIAKQDLPLDLEGVGDKNKTLAERFGVPPFSVLDARQGYWQTRKRAWTEIGIQSELGRGEGVTPGDTPEITGENLNYYRNRGNAPSQGVSPDGKNTRGPEKGEHGKQARGQRDS